MIRVPMVRECVVAVVAACCVTPALAADGKKAPDPEKVFAKKDANSDGTLSPEEFKTGLKDKALENADRRFKKIDANGDGKISLDEFKARVPAKNA